MKALAIILGCAALLFIALAGVIFMENKSAQPMSANPTNSTSAVPVLQFATPLTIGDNKIMVAVANDDATRAQGLSGQTQLSDAEGMLFDFKNAERKQPGFWMKDMQFPLDLVWIQNNTVTQISRDVPVPAAGTKLSDLPLYFPDTSIDYVLEVPAGWCARHNVNVGSKLEM